MSKPSIPSWQRAQAPEAQQNSESGAEESANTAPSPATPDTDTGESAEEPPPPSKDELLQQAAKFMQDPSIRDAPNERKAEFLKTKGVSDEDIRTLLKEPAATPQQVPRTQSTRLVKQPSSPTPPARKLSSSQRSQPPGDIPPVVTYPEFLTKPAKPPPLVTISRLLNTAYIASALAASTYALSHYVVKPMSENLTLARHDYAQHAQTHLDELNSRLKGMVSTEPVPKPKTTSEVAAEGEEDMESVTSDPTELFHRDFGTQTTPNLSRRASVSSTAASDHASHTEAIKGHENRLRIISSHLSELVESQKSNEESTESLNTRLDDLRTYLNDMSYSSPVYGYSASSGFYGGTSTSAKDDAIENFKTEIRSVKGVLLSARNFPQRGSSGMKGH